MMIYQFGPSKEYRLDTARRTFLRDGKVVKLNRKAFDTLCLLVENSGKVVRREELIRKVWGSVHVDTGVIDQNIHILRQLLNETRFNHQYIETVRGIGFRFIPPVYPLFLVGEDQTRDPYRRVSTTLADKYLLIKYIGRGGMGAVYAAVTGMPQEMALVEAQDMIAIKLLKPDLVHDHPDYALLFEREVQAVRQLEHPHIVRLIDNGISDDGIPFMAMEWLTGETLEDVIIREQLSIERIVEILRQICDAFSFAHANQIIHLDVKPSNIFVQEQPRFDSIKVIDFGMARVIRRDSGTTASRFLGTYQYCSPEHFGGKVSRRSDIYSLGVTLYHMIAGVLPFGGSYIHAKMYPNLELPPVPLLQKMRPSIPPAVDDMINKAISREPEMRQNDVGEFFDEFIKALG